MSDSICCYCNRPSNGLCDECRAERDKRWAEESAQRNNRLFADAVKLGDMEMAMEFKKLSQSYMEELLP